MGNTVLYIILIVLIAVFAILFICYRSRTDQPASMQPSDIQAATILYSRRGFVPSLGITRSHQHYQRYSGKVPTPPTIISNLPCVNYEAPSRDRTDGKDRTADDELPQCVICCCAFQEQEKVKLLPCLHMYHEECIDAWLQRDHICPICQADVILAAGLSLQADWSAHTLESVNIVSGAARRDTSPPAAAGPHAAAADCVEAPTGARPSTAQAAVSRQAQQQQQQQAKESTSAAEAALVETHAVQATARQCSVGDGRTSSSSSSDVTGHNAEHVVVTIRHVAAAGSAAA